VQPHPCRIRHFEVGPLPSKRQKQTTKLSGFHKSFSISLVLKFDRLKMLIEKKISEEPEIFLLYPLFKFAINAGEQ
jgi:hypothetical protein